MLKRAAEVLLTLRFPFSTPSLSNSLAFQIVYLSESDSDSDYSVCADFPPPARRGAMAAAASRAAALAPAYVTSSDNNLSNMLILR